MRLEAVLAPDILDAGMADADRARHRDERPSRPGACNTAKPLPKITNQMSQSLLRNYTLSKIKSLAESEQAIYDYIAKYNQNPVPFVWTATAKAILEKAARAKQTLETVRTKC